VLGAYLKGELSWTANIIFPMGLIIAVPTLFLSAAWLGRMKWRPRERESIALPSVGIILSCGLLLAAAHLHWTEFPYQLDDAWPAPHELPIYVRVYANPEEDGAPLEHLRIAPPHSEVEKIHRLLCSGGRVEVLGIQFRSALARRRWQEEEGRSRAYSGNGRPWFYQKAGGASIIQICDEGFQSDRGIREGLQKLIQASIGSAIDRQWNRPRDVTQNP